MKKHIIALIAVLALLVSALPMQTMADSLFPTITVNSSTSTEAIEKGGFGRVSLTVTPSRRSEERCAVVLVDNYGKTVSEYTILLENTTKNNRNVTVSIDTAGLALNAGEYKAKFWIESKNQSTSRWELAPEIVQFKFEVVSSRCGGNHDYKKTMEVKATCSQTGTVKYVCRDCDHVFCEETPLADHDYKLTNVFSAPDEDRGLVGEGEYVCATCTGIPASKIDIIPISAIVKITAQPKNMSVPAGSTARFTVAATGLDLTYQWQYKSKGATDWIELSATKAYLTVTNQIAYHENEYRCIVKDALGNEKISDPATLRVSDLLAITTQPKDASAYDGQKATISVKATGEELKYAWFVKDLADTDFWQSTITSSTYSVTMNDIRNGRQVYCVVTDKKGDTIRSDTVTLTTLYAVKITKQPTDVQATEGETVVFSVIATGGEPLKYQWYYRNKGATTWKESECKEAIYATELTAERNEREVYCAVTDTYGNTISTRVAEMKLLEVQIITQPKSVTAYIDDMATFTVKAVGVDLKYQWYYRNAGTSSWTKGSSTEDTYSLNMTNARDGRQVYCVVTDKYGKKVNSDVATMHKRTRLEVTGVSVKNRAYVGEKVNIAVAAKGDGVKYEWYFQDVGGTVTKSTITSATYSLTMSEERDGRQVYCVVVDAYDNSVMTDVVTLEIKAPPTITTQPTNQTTVDGGSVTFTVAASGESSLKYQWYYRNAGTSEWKTGGSTTTSYTTTMRPERDGREIYCKVTDASGKYTASNVVKMILSIPDAPGTPDVPDTPDTPATALKIITQPSNVTAPAGSTATVSVVAEGDGLKYTWYYRNAGASSWTKSSFASSSYTFDVTEARDGRQIYCKITDAHGDSVKTNTVKLNVNDSVEPNDPTPIEITSQPSNVTASAGSSATVSVKATGDGLKYQWYYRNAGSSSWKTGSSTSSSYTFDVTEARDGRQIYCKITDAHGQVLKSKTVTLTVN